MWRLINNKTLSCVIASLLVVTFSTVMGVDNLKSENLTITLKAGDYQITAKEKGEQAVNMDGFGRLLEPGKPMLPAKTFMIAIPPGAKVQSVVTLGTTPIQIQGRYNIKPAPPVLPADNREEIVKECHLKWQHNYDVTYSSDQAYPEDVGEYLGTGGLRKYTFVKVAYSPFSYRPQSGKLIFTPSLIVSINYTLPSSSDQEYEKMLLDIKGDQRASQLLVNYPQAKEWYLPNKAEESPKQTYDYVIITTDALTGALSQWVNWKETLGFSVNTVTTTWIQSNYSGSDLQQKIRNFLIDKYIEWGIEYVLLVGDVSALPMRKCYPNPANHSPNSEYCPPTDYYYADLTGNWDSDGDGYYGEYNQDNVDFIPEVLVGRIPFSDTTSVTSICQKLVNFEQDTSDWKNNALLLGAISNYANEDNTGFPRTDGAVLMETMISNMLSGWNYTTMYEQAGLDPCTSYCDLSLNSYNVVSNWSANDYGIVNWWAHGSSDAAWRKWWEWDDGDGVPEGYEMGWETFFQNYDVSSLDNDHSAIIFSCSCDNGYPEQDNLAKRLLNHGSAGIVASTRVSWYNEGWSDELSGGNASMDYYFYYYLIHENQKVGDALFSDKVFYLNHLFWSPHDPEWTPQQNMLDFNLYGDPSLVRKGVSRLNYGDCNGDGTVELGDVVYLITYLYKNGPVPNPLLIGDVNHNGEVELGDVVYLINYLYKSGLPPK